MLSSRALVLALGVLTAVSSACSRQEPAPSSAPSARPSVSPAVLPTVSAATSAPASVARAPASSSGSSVPAARPSASPAGSARRWTREQPSRTRLAGGSLDIDSRDATSFHFNLEVWSGAHMGQAEGRAAKQGDAYLWTEPGSAPDPCVVSFTPAGQDWQLGESGTCPHGFGVFFEGTYKPGEPVARASFDCRKASSVVEKLICSDDPLASLDRAVAQAYSKLPHTNDADPVVQAQRAWVKAQRQCAETQPVSDAAREAAVVCLVRHYLDRLDVLEGRPAPAAGAASRAPIYPDIHAALAAGRHPSLDDLPRAAGELRLLLGPRYAAVSDIVGASAFFAEGSAVMMSAAPRGLFTIMEAFIYVGPSDDIWVGILDAVETPDGSTDRRLELFAPAAQAGQSPPAAFDTWRSRFDKVPVVRKAGAGRVAIP